MTFRSESPIFVSLKRSAVKAYLYTLYWYDSRVQFKWSENYCSLNQIAVDYYTLLEHIFAVSGPTLWNSLPLSVRDPSLTLTQFCLRLKTVILQSIRNTSIVPT